MDCTWIISASSEECIKVTFENDTVPVDVSLEVRDGAHSFSPLIAYKSGTTNAEFAIVSSGSKLWIHFWMNASTRERFRDFHAFYCGKPLSKDTSIKSKYEE